MAGRRAKPRTRRKATRESSEYVDWVQHVRNASKKSTVVVHHKRDADVLKAMGVQHVYFVQEPYFRFLDALANLRRECILLFDATHAGNVICERVKSDLQNHGVKINTRFRKILFTSANRELGGFLKFLHEQVTTTPRKHEALPRRL